MNTSEFIVKSLQESREYTRQAIRELTADELSFRVKPFCNSIAFLIWHLGRVEDLWINRVLKNGKEIYESEGWYLKFRTAADDTGFGYDVAKLDAWPVPALELLLDYAGVVRKQTLEYLSGLDAQKLDEEKDFGWSRGTIGSALAHLVTEVGEHTGQIGYIKGILKGIEPPPGA